MVCSKLAASGIGCKSSKDSYFLSSGDGLPFSKSLAVIAGLLATEGADSFRAELCLELIARSTYLKSSLLYKI